MKFRRNRREIPALELTPLIDVIFQLLIFFLITTTFVTDPGITFHRPKAKNSGPLSKERYKVIIPKAAKDSVIFMNDRLTYPQFIEKLKELYKKEPETQIAIDADREVAHEMVVKVMDMISGVGFEKLGIVTSSEGGPPVRERAPPRR